jgi:hypothetical protein
MKNVEKDFSLPGQVYVFVGPSLTRTVAWPHCVQTLGPASRGVLLEEEYPPDCVVVLIDGAFMQIPPPSHLELLTLLMRGVRLIGAASIGALRAAELSDYGMIGRGTIFKAVKSGLLKDDAEVAVGMDPYNYSPTTIPLINVRRLLGIAHEQGQDARVLRKALLAAGNVFFLERTRARLLRAWREECPTISSCLGELLLSQEYDLKHNDSLNAINYALSLINPDYQEPADPGIEPEELLW